MHEHTIVLNEADDVGIALRGLKPGGDILEAIPPLHKFAVRDVAKGEPVHKYGQVIGYASKPIARGSWVHTHNLEMGRLLDDSRAVSEVHPPADPEPITDRYFLGYENADGRAGTRNYIVIASTVDCSARVVQLATEELNRRNEWIRRRFANVDGIVGLTHDSGCGLVALSPGHLRQNMTMRNLLDHPNVASSVVVQLGCEKSQAGIVFGELGNLGDSRADHRICRKSPFTRRRQTPEDAHTGIRSHRRNAVWRK